MESGGQTPEQGADTKDKRSFFKEKSTHNVEPSQGGYERILTVNRCSLELQELDGRALGKLLVP